LNIESLEGRKKQLNIQLEQQQNIIDQALANINAIHGALQECDHWIGQIEQVEQTKKSNIKKEE